MISLYERLREEALHPDGMPHAAAGMAVIMLRGMAGWLEALPSLAERQADARDSWHCAPAVTPQPADIVDILASMMIACGGWQ